MWPAERTSGGGDGRCPICAAQGHNVPETVEHQNTSCPLTTLVTRAWLLEWRTFTGESWTDTLTKKPEEIIPGTMTRWNRTLKRGVCLGLRPENESEQQDLYTMIRGFAVEAVTSLRNEVLRHKPGDPTPRAADLYHAAAVAYRHITQSLTAALEGDRWRYHLLERQMRGAGLIISQPGPMERWRAMWVQTGICTEAATGRLTQNVLRDQPLLGATQAAGHLRGTDGAETGSGTAPGATTNNDSTLRNRRRPTTRNHMGHGGRQRRRRRRRPTSSTNLRGRRANRDGTRDVGRTHRRRNWPSTTLSPSNHPNRPTADQSGARNRSNGGRARSDLQPRLQKAATNRRSIRNSRSTAKRRTCLVRQSTNDRRTVPTHPRE